MFGFVYVWYDKLSKKYYVGCHWGTEDDGYICSSSWMKKAYKKRPQDFKRKIVERVEQRKMLYNVEQRWLDQIKEEELGNRYYNLSNRKTGCWVHDESKSRSIRKKLSESLVGHICSDDTRIKIGDANRGKIRTPETKEKLSTCRLGSKHQFYGKKRPDHAEKMKQYWKAKKNDLL